MKCLLLLYGFKQNWIMSTNVSKNPKQFHERTDEYEEAASGFA